MPKKSNFDYIVIGAGPAGLQMGYYFQTAKQNYLIIEAGETAGTFFKTYPRHRTLLSINKVYTGYNNPDLNLRWDWNSLLSQNHDVLFKTHSKSYFPNADDLVSYLGDFADKFNLNIQYKTKIITISRNEAGFQLVDEHQNQYFCRRLIIATGISVPYLPPIPGIELTEDYSTVSVDPEAFVNQKVLIIGKGNSGFETAENLIDTASSIHLASPTPLMMAWKSHFVGHLRAVNNNFLDTYQLKSQNAVLNAVINNIAVKDNKFVVTVSYIQAEGEIEELLYDRVITCTGFRFDDSIFDATCKPDLTIKDRFPAQTSEWESTNVPDLYFVGVLTQARDYKKTTSAFIHGFRYNVQALYRILDKKYHSHPWPSLKIEATPSALTDAVIERVNKTSALWQQFGFICDLIVISPQGDEARYYEEVPVDYVQDSEFGQQDCYYTITLEYGDTHHITDPFNATRIERHNTKQSHQSNFLHPVIRRFSGSTRLSEHHVIEDLQSEWHEEVHITPLLAYFEEEIAYQNKVLS